jgi:RNA polymerase sigma-54 factor
VLEELDSTVPLLDEIAGRQEAHERQDAKDIKEKDETGPEAEKKDPFDEIDFGSFFRDYLDPGYRNSADLEEIDRPSFENFLSKPGTLSDHLMWQLGSVTVRPAVYAAAELVIGNLNEEGYLTASDDELMGVAQARESEDPTASAAAAEHEPADTSAEPSHLELIVSHEPTPEAVAAEKNNGLSPVLQFTRDDLREAIALIQHFDPVGVAARDLRECLMAQLEHLIKTRDMEGSDDPENDQVVEDALKMVDKQLHFLQNKQYKEIAKAIARPMEAVIQAHEFIRTLDPKPGLRYNKVEPKLIEPDVAFVKHGDEYLVLMNDEDLPQLRVSPTYRKMLNNQNGGVEKDVKTYVKERYKSAVQLIKNIEQRRQTILKVCYAIIGRQRDFLDQGIDQLKPMMIKEVAEEIGVHPSTVSRAVASKYVHTSQGVFELRYFFSESVQGPEGAGTSLLILKRRVKKLIEEEDPAHPLTDDQITRVLQSQGIQVTRRTVAKYREDMKIPSTHQRRTKS